MIGHIVQTEVVPLALGQQRIDLQGLVGTRTQAAESGDDEVVPRRVVVVARTLLVTLEPVARRLVEVFADVGLAAHVLALHILFEFGEIERVGNDGLAVVVEVVGHSGQRL